MKIKFKYYTVLLLVLSFLLFTNEVFARGGGGGSGGGGGGGGSGGSGGGSPIALAIWVIVFLIIGICSWYIRKQKIKKAKEIITKAEATDSAWQESALTARVSDVFIRFQKDWSDYNSEAMKEYCMPKFQEKMMLDLAVLQLENRKNLVNNPNLKGVAILEAKDEIDNTKDNFTAEVSAQANDQLIDTKTNSILMTENTPFTEYWNFLRDGDNWKLNTIKQATENKFLNENKISEFANKNNFFYDPDFGWLMMPNKGVIFRYSNFKTSDINNHVIGMFKGKIVELYTFIPKGNQNPNYLVAQTTLPVNYNDILVRRRRFFWNFAPRGLRRIETESNDFNKKFCLYAHKNDQINSFVLLAPDFMEEIYNLPFELNIEIVGSFLYFYVKGRKNVNEDEMMRLLSRAFDSMRVG
jgi:preprotein translocase subunit SecG